MSATAYKDITAGLGSTDPVLTNVKYSFFAGLAVFLLSLPLARSRVSFFDAIAARFISKCLRFVVFLEIISLCILFNFYMSYGNPIRLHAGLSYGNGDSWLYGYGRPIGGFVTIIMGLFGEMHPIPRMLCIVGSLAEVAFDTISAYQIHAQRTQVTQMHSLHNGYSAYLLGVYYWRDIVSIALCTLCACYAAYLSCLVGWCLPQRIHPSHIAGNEFDRHAVMHLAREKRKAMELRKRGIALDTVKETKDDAQSPAEGNEGSPNLSNRSKFAQRARNNSALSNPSTSVDANTNGNGNGNEGESSEQAAARQNTQNLIRDHDVESALVDESDDPLAPVIAEPIESPETLVSAKDIEAQERQSGNDIRDA